MHSTDDLNDGYLGSGTYFNNALKKYGKENFLLQILEYCDNYNDMIEAEKHYVDQDWVLSNDNYNLKTGGHSAGILSADSKKKISETLKLKYKNGEIIPPRLNNHISPSAKTKEKISNTLKEKYKNEEHHNKGKVAWNKGIKTNTPPWNKGLTGATQTEESNIKRSVSLIEHYKQEEHPRKGKAPWNKGLLTNKSSWNKGIVADKQPCPHCGKLANAGNLERWHMDNCKQKH